MKGARLFIFIVLMAALAAAAWWWRHGQNKETAVYVDLIRPKAAESPKNAVTEAQSCAHCHASEVEDWTGSEHANANRPFDPERDLPAFQTHAVFTADSLKTTIRASHGAATVEVAKPDGSITDYHPAAVIGVRSVIQYLIPFPGGRLQTLNLSWDPKRKNWFDFQAPDTRLPADWSHWQNRGLNWNSQCAFCHTTDLHKGYDAASDTYRTTWAAMGISCAQCHGSMEAHSAHPNDPAFFNRLNTTQTMDNCGSCHARREELDGNFHAGDAFAGHYRISLPDEPGIYYPDGQVKDEDFEFGSFMMSRMGQKGVTCMDCHNPHSGRLVAPVENNQLCLTCHAPPGMRGAIPIDATTHTHHMAGTAGSRCIDCHMPVTNYMVRDPRRDHGFTIPDPVLTKELGVPNSCNRCHQDKSADWAAAITTQWYGDKMERHSRDRARVIARADRNDGSVLADLLPMAEKEENAAWRSVLVADLTPWAGQPAVRAFLQASLTHPSPLVRDAAVRAISNQPDAEAQIKPLCADPVRLVRIDAAWGLRDARDRTDPAYSELTKYLDTICDQPGGALRKAQFAMDEQRIGDALNWSTKAESWDATSGDAHQVRAVLLNIAGRRDDAIAELRTACDLDPKNAQYPFMLALLYGEEDRADDVLEQLKRAVAIDPGFGRAWYNLGLALAQQEQLSQSITALARAEQLLPGTPEVPYALATVLVRAGRAEDARQAAARAQSLGYPGAADLVRQLTKP